VVVDPSAASFIAALRKRGFTVIQANNEVMDGIRRVAEYLRSGNIKIHRDCRDAIAEFGLYRWDEKATEDKVIKENDSDTLAEQSKKLMETGKDILVQMAYAAPKQFKVTN
jgi:hypothetical protein